MIDVIRADMISAMKKRDIKRKEILSLLLSSLLNKMKEKKGEINTADFIAVTKKEIKKIEETLFYYSYTPNNKEVIEDLSNKKQILLEYLPKEMTEKEVKEALLDYISNSIFPNGLNKGILMRDFLPTVRDKTDGKTVSKVVDDVLNNKE